MFLNTSNIQISRAYERRSSNLLLYYDIKITMRKKARLSIGDCPPYSTCIRNPSFSMVLWFG